MSEAKSLRACLRCRSRKTRCLGRNEDDACPCCVACRQTSSSCEVVPHKRGRKVGTKLSEEVRRRLRKRRTESPDAEETRPAVQNEPFVATAHIGNPRIDSHVAHVKEGEIGPTVRGASSIERLFAPRSVGPAARPPGLMLRADPIGYGYMDEALARDLFAFFMAKIAQNLFIFDPCLHTFDYVSATSSFLFSIVIAVAAKFRPQIPALTYKRCLDLAKSHISKVFTDDYKDEEAIIALFTMTEYKEPSDENGYLLLGIACRLAVDLELYKPLPHYDERRNRSRHRIWLALYAADRRYNYCGQTAKPSMMPEDALVVSSEDFRRSDLSLPTDTRLAGNVKLRRLMALSIAHFDACGSSSGSASHREQYHDLVLKADEWSAREIAEVAEPLVVLHIHTYTLHAKVVIAHRWLREAFKDDPLRPSATIEAERREVVRLCLDGSIGILSYMLAMPDDVFRYCGDSKHLYFAYASFFLYKTLKTGTFRILDQAALDQLFSVIRHSAEKLDRAALVPSHTAAYHANFLRSLLDFQAGVSDASHSNSPAPPDSASGLRQHAVAHIPLPVSYDHAAEYRSQLPGGYVNMPVSESSEALVYPPNDFTDDFANSASLFWDDWWPLDNNMLDQGIFDTLTNANNADTELQNILDSLFESSTHDSLT